MFPQSPGPQNYLMSPVGSAPSMSPSGAPMNSMNAYGETFNSMMSNVSNMPQGNMGMPMNDFYNMQSMMQSMPTPELFPTFPQDLKSNFLPGAMSVSGDNSYGYEQYSQALHTKV